MTNFSSHSIAGQSNSETAEDSFRLTGTSDIRKSKAISLKRGMVVPTILLFATTATASFDQNDPMRELQMSGASSADGATGQRHTLKHETVVGTRVSRAEARRIAIRTAEEVRNRVEQSRAAEAQLLREFHDTTDV